MDAALLSAAQKEYAAVNLNETDEARAAGIKEIRDWITEREDLRARTDDFSILRFLRSCKFNIEKTKVKIGNYYTQRAAMPEWYSDRNPFLPELQEMFNLGVFLPLRKLDQEGRMIVVIRAAVHDPSKHNQADVFKAGMMVLDLATRAHVPASLHGVIAILDLEGVSAAHALHLPPHVIRSLVHAWQGCYPLRIHSLNFVNAPTYVNVILKIFKSFMREKLKRRIRVHMRGLRVFCQNFPPEILPREYGGTDGTLRELIEHWKTAVEENREWFIDDEKYKATLPPANS